MANVELSLVGLDRRTVSFALAVKRYAATPGARHTFTITGYDEDPFAVSTAEKLEAIDRVARDAAPAVENADLVMVAMPYHTVKLIFELIGTACKTGAVVVDFSPLKLPSIDWAEQYFRRNADGRPEVYLVGATVVANSEAIDDPRTTPDAASADLFNNATLALSPAADCPPEAVALVSDLATLLGIKLRYMDAAEHDGVMAATEVLPLLLQLVTFQSIHGGSGWGDIQHLTNSTFTLATYRLALDNPKDVALLFSLNQANNLRVLEALIAESGKLLEILKNNDSKFLEASFEHASQNYSVWQQVRRGSKVTSGDEQHLKAGPRLFGALPGLIMGRGKRKDEEK